MSADDTTQVAYDTTGVSGTRRWSEPVTEPRPLPTEAWLRRCQAALEGSRSLRGVLHRERGLTAATARRFEVGWDAVREEWVLPVRSEWGQIVNLIRRVPKGSEREPKSRKVAGRKLIDGAFPLYPDVPDSSALIVCAGEWDSLLGRQHGLPTVSGLLGASWYSAWNEHVVGRRVALVYDVGEEKYAATSVRAQREAGADAWWVPLPSREPGYDLSDFLTSHTAAQLIAHIRRCRP